VAASVWSGESSLESQQAGARWQHAPAAHDWSCQQLCVGS